MMLTCDPTHEIDLGFSRSNFEIAVFQDWMGHNLFEVFPEMNKKIDVKL